MGVDQSPGGRNQPFYNVLGDDGSQRYAAHSKHGISNYLMKWMFRLQTLAAPAAGSMVSVTDVFSSCSKLEGRS